MRLNLYFKVYEFFSFFSFFFQWFNWILFKESHQLTSSWFFLNLCLKKKKKKKSVFSKFSFSQENDWLVDFNLSRIILCQEVWELCSLCVYIYIFCAVVSIIIYTLLYEGFIWFSPDQVWHKVILMRGHMHETRLMRSRPKKKVWFSRYFSLGATQTLSDKFSPA